MSEPTVALTQNEAQALAPEAVLRAAAERLGWVYTRSNWRDPDGCLKLLSDLDDPAAALAVLHATTSSFGSNRCRKPASSSANRRTVASDLIP